MSRAVLQSDGITHLRKLHLALELSNAKWLLAFSDGSVASPKLHQIDAGDLDLLAEKIAAAKKAFGFPADRPVVSCYEAGRDGFWIHRALAEKGIQNTVVEPSCLATGRQGRKPKTDRLDATALVAMLVRFARGERNVWRTVRVPTEEQEDARRLVRRRERLIKNRGRYANAIQSVLITQSVRIKHGAKLTPAHLDGLRRWNGSPLPPAVRGELDELLALLVHVNEQLAALEKKLKDAVKADPLSQALMRIMGVGPRSAQTLSTELFGWRKFANRREVGAIAGLVGTPFQSGSIGRERGISKAGNRRVRTIMVELAWFWLRHQEKSGLARWYHERVGRKPTSRQKRLMIVAMARKLLILLWRYATTGKLPEDVRLKAEPTDNTKPKNAANSKKKAKAA